MNISIQLGRVEYEMLKELQLKDSRYRKGLSKKIALDINSDYSSFKLRKGKRE